MVMGFSDVLVEKFSCFLLVYGKMVTIGSSVLVGIKKGECFVAFLRVLWSLLAVVSGEYVEVSWSYFTAVV